MVHKMIKTVNGREYVYLYKSCGCDKNGHGKKKFVAYLGPKDDLDINEDVFEAVDDELGIHPTPARIQNVAAKYFPPKRR